MPGKKEVDRTGIGTGFDEEKEETLRVQDVEFCDDGGAAKATPRTAVHTPQVSSTTAGHDGGGDDPSTPVPSSPGAPARSTGTRNKELSLGRRGMMRFQRFLGVGFSPGMAKEHSVPEGDVLTPRSAGRSIRGTKDTSRSNEDRFFAIDDIFAPDTLPRSPPAQPLPLEGGAAAGGAAGGAQEDTGRLSAIVGKVGLYGVFDGHGGSKCASFVSANLPQGIKNSPAWACVAIRDDDNITPTTPKDGGLRERQRQHEGGEDTEGEVSARPENRPAAVAARGDDGLDDLLAGVMAEAILDGFRSTQEAFARRAPPGQSSGSTAIVAMVCRRQVIIANLGDSGGLFHNDQDELAGGSLTAKTEFHAVGNKDEKERVEAAGGFFTDERLFGTLQPTRSFGDQELRRRKEGVLIAVPELTVQQIRPTANGVAFLVLGSDGLWDGVTDSQAIDVVRAKEGQPRSGRKPGKVPLRVAKSLVKKAARVTTDDITAVVILFHEH